MLVYGITAAVYLAIDILWLSLFANFFYDHYLGGMLREQINVFAALLFHLIYILGIVNFVWVQALQQDLGALSTCLKGALLDLFACATFDLNALTLFIDWPIGFTLVDMTLGTVLTTGTAAGSLLILRKIVK